MAKSIALNIFAATLVLATQGCGSEAGSPPSAGAGGGTAASAGGAASGSGGASAAGASAGGGSAAGASAGASGSGGGTPGGGGSGSAGIDLSGTWIAEVKTVATESLPIVGNADSNLRLVLRFLVSRAGDTLNATFDICDLTTVTTPDPKQLSVTFTPAVLATLTTATSEAAPSVMVGDPVPLPKLTIRSGVDLSGKPVDSDADSHPGVTLPGNIGGVLPVNAYVGLTIESSLSPKLTTTDSIEGTATFSAKGTIFGSDNPLLTSGTISVAPKAQDVPFTARRLAGDVPCSDVLKEFP
ncbi:MAG TPA: hypothetical protein VF395_07735 [Polyangiaceae bacterium]